MKLTCDIIKDILPLYSENIASTDSRVLIEEHISTCANCKKLLEEMGLPHDLPIDTDITSLKKLKATLQKKKLQTTIFSVILSLIIFIIILAYLSTPNYIPHNNDPLSIKKIDDKTVLAIFSDEVSGYNINRYLAENNLGYVYHITAWTSFGDRKLIHSSSNTTILNTDGEKVDAVYYYSPDMGEDVLLYGANQSPNGGVLTLPRLVLAYYLFIAIALTIVFSIALLIFRHKEKTKNIIIYILFLPIAYICSHFCIKGFTSSSYSALHDFFTILLIMIPIYFAFLIGLNLLRQYHSKS